MDFSGVLNTVLAIATIVAGALAGLQRGVVQNLRDTNKDLRDRASDLEKERDDDRAENAALKADLAALGRVVTNEVQIAALTEAIHGQGDEFRAHRAKLEDRWEAATEIGQSILDELHQIRAQGDE